MAGFFEKYVIGGTSRTDFTKEQLPENRLQLFWQMLKVRIWTIVQVNMQFVLFLLPTIAWTIMNLVLLSNPPKDLLTEEAARFPNTVATAYLLGLIPLLTIAGPAFAGLIHVLRNWARDEHAGAWDDFGMVLRRDFKKGAGYMFLNALVLFVVFVGTSFYGHAVTVKDANAEQMIFSYVGLGITLGWGIIYAMMSIYIFPLFVTYTYKFKQIIMVSFYLAVARLPQNILILLAIILPAILLWGLWPGAFLMIYCVAGIGLTCFAVISSVNATFDKTINPHIKGAKVNQGLKPKDNK